jgi:hypothetical protein
VRDFRHHVFRTPGAVTVAADGLRPQAEGAARLAAAPGIKRNVRMLQVTDKIIFDHQIALVNIHHPRQLVHIFDHGAVAVMHHLAIDFVADAVDFRKRTTGGDIIDGKIEFVARDEVNRGRMLKRKLGLHGHVRADEANHKPGVFCFQRFGDFRVGFKRGRAGMQNGEFIIVGKWKNIVERQAARGCVNELAAGHQCRRLGEPSGIPERADLPPRLIT